ncbi:hypothetical protein JYU19_02600 [bacterium AH-315-J21]|nr:hypothetical protein [bacterium AH-315-J21]
MPDASPIGIFIAGLLTLGIFSFLYKDNPVYKVCEAIFIGVSAAYWAVEYFYSALYRKFWLGVYPPEGTEPDILLWGGAILGALMLCRMIPKINWLSRWPLAFIVGATAGLYMMLFFVSNAMKQIESTLQPLIQDSLLETLGSFTIAIGTITGLIYFFFSKEHKGIFGGAAKVGIWVLMVTFGASFGYTVMSRMSLLIGRLDFMFNSWATNFGQMF